MFRRSRKVANPPVAKEEEKKEEAPSVEVVKPTAYEKAQSYKMRTTSTKELVKRKIKDDRILFSRGIRSLGYYAFKDTSLFFSTFIGRFVGFMIGLFVLNAIIIIWWIQRKPTCPLINGQVCNAPHGYCSAEGNCQCVSVLYSGQYCEHSACDEDCGEFGTCWPWMKREFVLPECLWENPTRENGFKISFTGWQNPVCKEKIGILKHRLFDLGEDLSDRERSTIPICMCETPRYGRGCSNDACPKNIAQEVCSNHGNVSVGFFNNETVSGIGCQCKTPFQILDFVDDFSPEMIEYVKLVNEPLLTKQYCADSVVRSSNSFYLKINVDPNKQQSPLKCYCDEETGGYACEEDNCPRNPLGEICSGRGAPNLGFGLEFNAKTKKHSRCRANCISGKKWCPAIGVCREDCAIEDNCPLDRPFRCRNQKCVSNKTVIAGGERGYLEHITPFFVMRGNESMELVSLSTPLVGINIVNGSATIYYSISSNETSVTLNSTNRNWLASYPIAQERINLDVEYRFILFGNLSWFMYPISNDTATTASAVLNGGEYTLVRRNGDRVRVSFEKRQEIILFDAGGFSSKGYLVFQNNSQQYAWINQDEFVLLSECTYSLDASLQCEFVSLPDGNYSKVGVNANSTTFSIPLPTVEETEFLKITYVTGAVILYPVSFIVTDEAYFMVERIQETLVGASNDFLIVWDQSVTGGYVEYYTQEQLLSTSPICTQFLDKSVLFSDGYLNQSQFNKKWFIDPAHPISTTIGDYVVYYSFMFNSWERGRIVSQDQEIENIKKANIIEVSGSIKRAITKKEHDKLGGLVECPPWLFFYKNKCIWPEFAYNTRTETINCTHETLSDVDCLNSKPQCEIYANIFTLIRYIYRTDGNFTYPIGDVVYADNVTQVFFTLEDNQTQVPENWTLGEYHPQAFSIDVIRLASSSPDTVNNTMVSTLKWWEPESWDHYVYMELQSVHNKITLALIHLRSNTIQYGNDSIVIPVYFQLFVDNSWENHTIFSSQVNETILLPINKSTNRIRLLGVYRFSIYEFNAYTIQQCRENDTTALITAIGRNVRNDTLYKTSKGMNYSDSCVARQVLPANGVCEDELELRALYNVSTKKNYTIQINAYNPLEYYTVLKLEIGGINLTDLPSSVSVNVSGNIAIINSDIVVTLSNTTIEWNGTHFVFYEQQEAYFNYTVTKSGEDYLDCGPSTRPFNTTLPGVDCIFSNTTIMDFLNYTWSVNVTRRRDYLLPFSCPFGRLCEDGSCMEVCSETFHCDGNGCQRPNSNSGFFKCACKQGTGGLECQYDECKPPVTNIRLYDSTNHDPHRDCRVDPGLKIKPPASLLLRFNVDNKEVERLNRNGVKRLNAADVRNILVKPHHGPYAIPLSVKRLSNNYFVNNKGEREREYIYSDCPYVRMDSLGRKITLDDDVAERTSRGVVKSWKIYYDETLKRNVTFPWSSETAYDDFNQRCPSGSCERGLEYCLDDKVCNGNGKLLVDGTCKCNYGWTTAIYTESNTLSKQVSYYFDYRYNLTDPTLWDFSNNNWRDYMGEYCMARDCTIQDCSPPLGCFTGTPPDFKDSHIRCDDGGCAINAAECSRGVSKTPKIPCSGNGIVQKRDYRIDQEEYYCECGFSNVENATQSTQLIKNGFGGPFCSDYTCSDTTLKFSRFNQRTKKAYQDKFGRTLRGVWEGYCGAHIGPSPDELPLWQMCCPTASVYKPCNNVPCEIDGKVKCTLSEECIPSGGVPKVYVCNKKGTGRADGTCDCNRDEVTGKGYTTDYNLGEDNCFKEVNCPISLLSGTPCNNMPRCSDPTNWIEGINHPYFNQQARIILAKQGKGFSNATLIREISDITEIESLKLQAAIARARKVQAALADVATCIYIDNENDTNNSFPIGMLPYTEASAFVIQPYQKAYESSYLLNFSTINETVLKNDIMTAMEFSQLILWKDYVIMPNKTTFNFSEEAKITAIRVHARGRVPNGDTITVKFYSPSGVVCPLVLIGNDRWNWTEQYCTSIYRDYDYNLLGDAYLDVCSGDDVSSIACIEFKEVNCPGRYLPISELHVTPRGCETECCILVQESAAPDVFISQVMFVTDADMTNIAFDEVQFYGYTKNTVKPVPPGLFPGGVVNGTCSERPDLRYAEQYLGDDKSYFVLDGEYNITDARIEANRRGAWVAAPISAVGLDYQSDSLKEACLKAVGLNKFCFIEMADWNFSFGVQNISYFFNTICTATGCFFEASNEVDIYSARNSSIYKRDERWGGYNHQIWERVLRLRDDTWWLQNFRIPYLKDAKVNQQILGINTNVQYLTDIYEAYRRQVVSFANLLDFWQPHDFGLQTTPEQPSYLWDKDELLNTKSFSLKLYPITYAGNPTQFALNENFRKITFQTTREIWERFDVVDWGPDANRVPFISACAAGNGGPQFGYCGDYLRDAFPYDFFGVELLNWLEKSNKTGYYTSKWHKFNNLDLPLRGNVKSIVPSKACYVVLKIRLSNGTITRNTHLLSIQTPFNIAGSLLELQVYPFVTGGVFRKSRFRVKGQPRDNDVTNGSEHTMGWLDSPWMGMRVFTHQAFRFEGNITGIDLTSPAVPLIMREKVGTWVTWGGDNYSLPTTETVMEPSIYLGPNFTSVYDSTLTFDDVNSRFVTTRSRGRPIVSCHECEIKHPSNWNFNPHVSTKQGFPKQATAVKDSGIVIRNWKITGVNIRLDDMPKDYKNWHGFARQSVVHLLPDYLTKFVKDWCAAVSSSTGFFHPMPCETKLPVIAQYDFTKYVALPGRVGNYCGYSSRNGGYAQPGVTCIDGFPLANATLFPFDHLLLQKLLDGTLNLYIRQTKYDYDKAVEFYENKPIVWAIGEAWTYWYNGFVDRTGYSLTGNSYDWLDFSLVKHFGYDCGARVSERTGLILNICAVDVTACDPDLVFDPVRLESDIPGIYTPTDVNVTNPICGTSIRPATFLVRDRFGGLTPGFSDQFEVLETFQNGAIKIITIGAYTQVFNTGKSSHMFVFEGNFTIAGSIEFECAAACVGNVTIWIAKLDVAYSYPPSSSKIDLISAEIIDDRVTYEINAFIEQNATYQVLGWDFNLTGISIITLENAIATNEESMEACARLIPPILWEAPPAVVSSTPENRCIYNKMDLVYYGDDIGKCHCAHMMGGVSCDCPSIRRNVCGGFGDYGLLKLGDGTDVAADSEGCYVIKEKKTAGCKCLDVGKYFYTRLLFNSAYDYLKVYVQDNIYDEFAYVVINASTGVINQTTVETEIFSSANVPISFVNGDELDDYLTISVTKPVLMDLKRTGRSDIIWNSRGIHLDGGGSITGLSQIPTPHGNWTSDLIDAINFDNRAFNKSDVLHDGYFVYYSNITTWNTTLTEIKNIWIYATSANNTSSNCMLVTGSQWICSAGNVGFSLLNVSEIQVYDIGTTPVVILL